MIGNVCKDVEMHTTQGGVKRADFTLAVNRPYRNSQGQREADFIRCVTWRERAEFAEKYLAKSKKISVVGSLQVRTYDTQDGQKRTVSEVVVDEIEFVTPAEKQQQNAPQSMTPEQAFGDKLEYTENPDPDLPF